MEIYFKSRHSGVRIHACKRIAEGLIMGECISLIGTWTQMQHCLHTLKEMFGIANIEIEPIVITTPRMPYEFVYDKFGEIIGMNPIEQTSKIVGYKLFARAQYKV